MGRKDGLIGPLPEATSNFDIVVYCSKLAGCKLGAIGRANSYFVVD